MVEFLLFISGATLFKNLLKAINVQKNNIIYLVIVLIIFSAGLFAGRQFSTYKSNRVLQAARQELELARNENQQLTDQLSKIRGIITRGRAETDEAETIIRDSRAILQDLIATIQEIANILENPDGGNCNLN